MKKKKLSKTEELKKEEEYFEFLQKRLNSENYKNNVSSEEYEKTKQKFKNLKFRIRILKESLK